jgi:hypothetical protein
MKTGMRTLIYEYQAQVVASRVLLVDFAEGGREVEATQEQSDWDCLSCFALAKQTSMIRLRATYLATGSHP